MKQPTTPDTLRRNAQGELVRVPCLRDELAKQDATDRLHGPAKYRQNEINHRQTGEIN